MSLKRYNERRDFKVTPEPAGKALSRSARALSYVIQKHDASRLHYDFRLELEGVLKSWAVPKGPSLDPSENRLAVHVEDHPIEYGSFEGIIPEGNYGAGNVIIWDRGVWIPHSDPQTGYRKGKLGFDLDGEKLKGGWALFRIGKQGKSDNWMLKKKADSHAKRGGEAEITERETKSVVSGIEVDDALGLSRSWGAGVEATSEGTAARRARTGGRGRTAPRLAIPEEAPSAVLPHDAGLQLATAVDRAPDGDEWCHEIKFDGYRILAVVERGKVSLQSRGRKSWSGKFKALTGDLSRLRVETAVLDGEAVVLDEQGRSDFQRLQNALSAGDEGGITYFVFDLLYLNGKDLRHLPLAQRKELLSELLSAGSEGAVRYSEHIIGNGARVWKDACKLGLEGIVSKKLSSIYSARRTAAWLKVKCQKRQEFVIIGYSPTTAKGLPFGALHLGYYDQNKLCYAGKVGTGFSDRSRKELAAQFRGLMVEDPPAAVDVGRGAIWLKPTLVCEVEFTEWTSDGRLRHPSFKGLREDKPAKQISREPVIKAPSGNRAEPSRPSARRRASAATGVCGVELSNADREVFSGTAVSKRNLAQYYERVQGRMLPLVRERPLTLVRCPAGIRCFYQKHKEGGLSGLPSIEIKEDDGSVDEHVFVEQASDLITLVQMNVIEIHLAGSRASTFETPDRLVFDLDPDPELPWRATVEAARALKLVLEALKLQSFVKTTGGKGVHLYVPVNTSHGWDELRAAAKGICAFVAAADPERFVMVSTKAKRRGKIYLDYLRNGRSASSIAPYSTRARPGLPVSTPIDWKELGRAQTMRFDTVSVPKRKKDPWADFDRSTQKLSFVALRRAGIKAEQD